MTRRLALFVPGLAGCIPVRAGVAAPGRTDTDPRRVLDRTRVVTLAPVLPGLGPDEKASLDEAASDGRAS